MKNRISSNLIKLSDQEIPREWFNVQTVLPEPLPQAKDPEDGKESRIGLQQKIRVKALQEQDKSTDQWIPIPDDVITKYLEIGRPTPLYRARNLEKYLETPARIYIKREDLLPTHSFKLNTSIAQAYFAKQEGARGLVSETGAGQWGLGLSYACNLFDLECIIFWVKISLAQKQYRAKYAEMLGATIYPSPSNKTRSGREVLNKNPDHYGSLGTGIGDAISYCIDNPKYNYVSGSNLPHVLLHQTIIGLETKKQLEIMDEVPDKLIACVGGGSNLGGFMNPFIPMKLESGQELHPIGAESDAAPRLTRGNYRYDHSDPVGFTPLSLSYTLGMDYTPPPVHVGGLRQHSGSAVIGVLRHSNLLDAYSYSQEDAFKAGKVFIDCERFIPAPETCHAIKATIDFALEAKQKREEKVIVTCFSGNGILDLNGYIEVLN